MKTLKEILEASVMDIEGNMNIIENELQQDLKKINDALKSTNYKLPPKGSYDSSMKPWMMKEKISLTSNILFNTVGIDAKEDCKLSLCPVAKYDCSYVCVDLYYKTNSGNKEMLSDYVYVDSTCNTLGQFIKYMKNEWFKDKDSIITFLKSFKETGKIK